MKGRSLALVQTLIKRAKLDQSTAATMLQQNEELSGAFSVGLTRSAAVLLHRMLVRNPMENNTADGPLTTGQTLKDAVSLGQVFTT